MMMKEESRQEKFLRRRPDLPSGFHSSSYFFSDSSEGIKTQIWIALIAQLIFSVIHRQINEAEAFATLVNVAANHMSSYVGLVKFMKAGRLKTKERDLQIVQLQLFELGKGGVFQNNSKNTPDGS